MVRRAPVYIYALIDPTTELVRYVGKSVQPRTRLGNHMNDTARTWRTNWLRSLKNQGLKPTLRVLEKLSPSEDWQEAERRWIAHGHAEGWPLTNCTSGGDGVPDLPAEVRERMRQVWIGRKHKPETLEKIGASSRLRRWTPERTEVMRQHMQGREFTTEWMNKIRRSLEKLTPDQVTEIRCYLTVGIPQHVLAGQFGVHQGTICNINRGRSYADVGEYPALPASA